MLLAKTTSSAWEPLDRCLWCTACGAVVASNAVECAVAVESLYCPATGAVLDTLSAEDVDLRSPHVAECPDCGCQVPLGGPRGCASCSFCGWTGTHAAGIRLRPLVTRRCRACVAHGLTGILCRPSLLLAPAFVPGADDAAAAWYRKLSAAAKFLPALTLAHVTVDEPPTRSRAVDAARLALELRSQSAASSSVTATLDATRSLAAAVAGGAMQVHCVVVVGNSLSDPMQLRVGSDDGLTIGLDPQDDTMSADDSAGAAAAPTTAAEDRLRPACVVLEPHRGQACILVTLPLDDEGRARMELDIDVSVESTTGQLLGRPADWKVARIGVNRVSVPLRVAWVAND